MVYMMLFSMVMFSLMLMTVTPMVAMKKDEALEKMSPFECGFQPKTTNRTFFSVHFFILLLIFLIFDVEIAIIIPAPMMKYHFMMIQYLPVLIIFIMVLLIGIIHEWNQKSLEWKL